MTQRVQYIIQHYYPLALQSILALALAGIATAVTKGVLIKVGEYELELKKKPIK